MEASGIKKLLIFGIMGLFVIPLFFFRDVTPENELKYLSIAGEALRNGNLFAFYHHGIPYADKPPLYFWMIMLVKNLTGTYCIPLIGIFSLGPAILIMTVMSTWSKGQLDDGEQVLASGMLFTTAMFLGAALLIRMDMLMAFFITMSLFVFYRCYTGIGRSFEPHLIWVLFFLALFTKGPLGILIPLLSIIVFLLAEKKLVAITRYLSISGCVLFLFLVAVWLSLVYLEGGKDYLYDLTVKQTVGRAVSPEKHKEPIYYYLQNFPVTALPWALMYLVTFIIGIKDRNQVTPLEKFFRIVVISTFILLSIIRGKLEIYLLPVYPFIVFLTLLQFKRFAERQYWKWCLAPSALSLILFLPGVMASAYVKKLPIKPDIFIYTGLILVVFLGMYSVTNILKGRFEKSSWGIIGGVLILVFFLSFKAAEMNGEIGLRTLSEKAKALHMQYPGSSYYAYSFKEALNMDVYLDDPVIPINNENDFRRVAEKKDIIVFLQKADVLKNDKLRDIVADMEKAFETSQNAIYCSLVKK